MEDRLLSTLGICRKAGKLHWGFDVVAQAARDGQVVLVLLAEDLSPKSGKEMTFVANKYGVELYTAPFRMDDVHRRLGKRSGILGVADQGLAGTIKAYLNVPLSEEDSIV